MSENPPRSRVRTYIENLSLRSKVTTFLIFVIILPFSIGVLLLLQFFWYASVEVGEQTLDETSKLVEQQLLRDVAAKAQLYDLSFQGTLVDLQWMKNAIRENGVRKEYLEGFYYDHPFIERIYAVKDGVVVSSIPEDATSTPSFVLKPSAVILGSWVGPYGDSSHELVSYVLPIGEKGDVRNYLAFDVRTERLFTDLARFDPSEMSYMILVRSNGAYIASSRAFLLDFPAEQQILGETSLARRKISDIFLIEDRERGVISSPAMNGKIVAFANVPSYDGNLFVVSPSSELLLLEKEKSREIEQVVQKLGFRALGFLVTLSLCMLLLSYYLFGKWIIRPIEILRAGIEKLKHSNRHTKIRLHGQDEIGQLGRDFNDMAEKLQRSYEGLAVEKEKLQDSIALMDTMVAHLPVGALLVDAKSKSILLMNHAGASITGHAIEEVMGHDYRTAFHMVNEKGELYPIEERPLSVALEQGKVCHKIDMVVIQPSGERRNLSATAAPIRGNNGEVQSAVSVFSDITDARVIERSRDEFFAVAAHEFRTPLTAIRGNAEMILSYYADKVPDEEVRSMLKDIASSSMRIITMVNEFLDVSRMEQGKLQMKKETFPISEITERVGKSFHAQAASKHIKLTIDPCEHMPLIHADRLHTERALSVLLDNAIKFTKEGEVRVSFLAHEKEISVHVSDTGIGIAESNQKLLFRKFQQAGEYVLARDSSQSSGLGLYIARTSARLMNGDVALEKSALGRGSTFVLTLPVAEL